MGKRLAILQSNYLPWKGYFDLIASVDEFVLYDDAQFTKNDWRNRNRIRTPQGIRWLSVPVGGSIHRRVRDVPLPRTAWASLHWKTLEGAYRRARHFDAVAPVLSPHYLQCRATGLSELNRDLLETVCAFLGIRTKLSNSWDYRLVEGRTERLVSICEQAGAGVYVSGPRARAYLDEERFAERGIRVAWFEYPSYPPYPQLWDGEFVHDVSIVDLLFNCGPEAPRYMGNVRG